MSDEHRKARLNYLIAADYESRADFAKNSGQSRSRVTQMAGNKEPFGEEAAENLAEVLGLPLTWFNKNWPTPKEAKQLHCRVDGDYPGAAKAQQSNVAVAPDLRAPSMIPVVGEVKGGHDGYLEEFQYPVGHGEGFVEYWTRDDAAYALRVRGDSMHPRYRAGEFVVVSPGIEPSPGNDVVVACKDGRKMLKQLNWKHDDEVQLLSINNGYAPQTIALSDILSIQKVAGRVERDGFIKN